MLSSALPVGKAGAASARASLPGARPGEPLGAPPSNPRAQTVPIGRPFAALPHDIEGDPRLRPVDKAILLALLFFARVRATCWPSNETIGERAGASAATVKRGLGRLEAAGHVARRAVKPTPANMTGREITLSWRVDPSYLDAIPARADPKGGSIAPHPVDQIRPSKKIVLVRRKNLREREDRRKTRPDDNDPRAGRPRQDRPRQSGATGKTSGPASGDSSRV